MGRAGAVPAAALVAIFIAAAVVIWVAGIQLSDATDALDARLGLGSALGGLVLLAFATNLPEVAITVSAAASNNLQLAVGNLVGGVAIQTLVLALLDARSRGRPLTHRVGSLVVVLEASTVVVVLVAAIMTTQLPASTSVGGISPGSLAVALLWLGGLVVIDRARKGIPWRAEAPGAQPGRTPLQRSQGTEPQPFKGRSTPFVAGVFALAAVLTLAAGVAIEESGSELADRIGLAGAVFGATILAASTALPEVSTGLASVKLGDHELAFADIFGGNAFLPVLFLLADVVAGAPALPTAAHSDIWMAGLGVVLTGVYVGGLVVRPARKRGPLGPDSWLAVALYAVGIAGLLAIA
jgi:cation:H+ antiporter